jgi:hypothetical protein
VKFSGVPVMQKLKEITFSVEEMESGAAIRISSKNPHAIEAIHEFLRFQIDEDKTSDSQGVSE